MSQLQHQQTVAPFEQFMANGKEISFLAELERTCQPLKFLGADYVIEVCVSGTVIFDESSPGFFAEDMTITDEDGDDIDVTDDEYRKFCFQLIEKYMTEAV